MRRSLRFVVIGSVIAAFLILQPYRVALVDGGSMTPTYDPGSLVLTSRFHSNLRHGDAVVFRHDGETFVKRVAFLPGDKILQFWFDDAWTVPNSDFIVETIQRHHIPKRLWTIPEGQVFVVGDNFLESVDSRTFGTIPMSDVLGTVQDAPRPEMIQGFAGADQFDDDSAQVVVRKLPLTGKDAARARLYVATIERRQRLERSESQN